MKNVFQQRIDTTRWGVMVVVITYTYHTILQDLSLYCFNVYYNIKKWNMNGLRMRLVEQDSLM